MKELEAKQYLLDLLPAHTEITDDTNLIEAGLDSLSIMKLNSIWRKAGSKVSFAKLISDPFWSAWRSYLNFESDTSSADQSLQSASSEVNDPSAPFPLTQVQYAYWAGRQKHQILGGFGCHCYVELDGTDIDTQRLAKAWSLLLMRHPMLRVRFLDDGTQQYMSEPYNKDITIYDLRDCDPDQAEQELISIRSGLSHRQFRIELGEVAGLGIALLHNNRHRIFFDVDLLVADVHSFQIILNDLGRLYREPINTISDFHFGTYLRKEAEQNRIALENDRNYWMQKIDTMPLAPVLPLAKEPSSVKDAYFTSRKHKLPEKVWKCLKAQASKYGVTPSMVLLCVYGLVIANYSEQPDFLINIPTFNRNTEISGIEDVVADFTRLSLLPFHKKDGESFAETVRRTAADFYEIMEHPAYSGVEIIRELNRKYGQEMPVAPVVFACNIETSLTDHIVETTLGTWNYIISQTPQVWLDFQMYEDHGSLLLKWDSVRELFDPEFLDLMFADLTAFLEKAAECDWNSEILCRRHDLLQVDIPQDANIYSDYEIHEGFFETAVNDPDLPALINAVTGEELSYGQAAKAALGIAHELQERGFCGEKIAVMMPRGIRQIIAILGIVASGNCYVPVNPEYPHDRQAYIFEKASIQYALTSEICKDNISDKVQALITDNIEPAEEIADWKHSSPDSSAYIIFTSGSTGNPKGVEISHRSAVNTIRTINEQYGIEKNDRVLAVSAVDFDLSVYDIFGTLSAGAGLVILDDAHKKDALFWHQTVTRFGVTFWNSVPAFVEMLCIVTKEQDRPLDSLRHILMSGDWIAVDLPERLQKVAPNAKVVSLGGATEAAIWSNFFDVKLPIPSGWRSIPYGSALKYQKYRVVDEKMHDCPPYKKGELLIGGIGLAIGYVGDEKLTAERFIYDQGERWYRTGDFGRYWADGTIEFLGRNDDQVKLNGYRIELGEIEQHLSRYKGIREAKAVVITRNAGQSLTVFLCPENPDDTPDEAELRSYLQKKIPHYMIPNRFVTVSELPLNRNGKVDVKALRSMETAIGEERKLELPHSGMESEIAEEWIAILQIGSVDRNTSFFELGGDSLTATSLCMRLRKKFDIAIPLEKMFEWKTIRLQTEGIEKMQKSAAQRPEHLPKVVHEEKKRFEIFELSDIQTAYWLGKTGDYALSGISTVFYYELETGILEPDRLQQALRKLIYRHDMMRTVLIKGEAMQQVLATVPEYTIPVTDLTVSGQTPEQLREEMSHPVFDESVWPLFKMHLVRISESTMRLMMCFNNIIYDGYSIAILLDELGTFYREPERPVTRESITFRDYLETMRNWKRGKEYEADREYWMQRAETMLPAPELPVVQGSDRIAGERLSHIEARLSAAQYERLRSKAAALDITPTAVLLSAYGAVLAGWSKTRHFTLNLTRFNRIPFSDEIHQVVGDFTSLVLADIDCRPELSITEFMQETQKKLAEDLSHPYYSGVDVLREYARRNEIVGKESMPIVFTSALGFAGKVTREHALGRRVYNSSQTPQVWLDHQVMDDDNELILSWDYVEKLFPNGMIEDMFNTYVQLLEELAKDDEIWDKKRDYLHIPYMEERQLANCTDAPVSELTLLDLFAQNLPDGEKRIAIRTTDRDLTYGEIDKISSCIAETLINNGVKPNTLVAVVMDKGWEQIAAAVAAHKSGAAYYPIDINFPSERIQELLEMGEVTVVLTQSSAVRKWDTTRYLTIDVDLADSSSKIEATVHVSPDDLAYVICTSGTTGTPKGVEITHRGAVNTILDVNRRFSITAQDSTIALSNLNFDLSVYDIFGMFQVGGTIVVPDAEKRKEPKHWIHLIEDLGVTVWNTVPMYMEMLVTYAENTAPFHCGLQKVLLSGDWIAPTLPDRMRKLWGDMDIISLGGATEASIWSNYYVTHGICGEMRSIPYGRPLTNQRFYVLDDCMQDRPVLVPGKLYIGGLGLARGYWKQTEKTREEFVAHPVTGERLYDTGDMGRYLPGGEIEFLGRSDHQVKIGGYRIELGEIENVLERIEGIRNAVVTVVEQNNSRQIGCHLILDENGKRSLMLPDENSTTVLPIRQDFFEKTVIPKEDIDQIQIFHQAMDAVSMELVLAFIGSGTFDAHSIRQSMAPEYVHMTEQWCEYLCADGLLEQQDDGYIWKQDPFEYYKDQASGNELRNDQYRMWLGEIRERLEKYQTAYSDVLKGHKEAISFYLEDDGGLTPKVFGKYAVYDGKAASAVNELVTEWCREAKQPLQILELGTRVQPLLEKLYPLVETYHAEYTYMDESDTFLKQAEKLITEHDHLHLLEKDIEQICEIGENDLLADVILANNTLHRRCDLDKVMDNVSGSLKTGGMLIMIEQVQIRRFVRNVIGIYETEEPDRQLFLNDTQWCSVLERHGFRIEGILPVGETHIIAASYQGIHRHTDVEKLRTLAGTLLPDYMVPRYYKVFENYPVSSNGKVDRKQLAKLLEVIEEPQEQRMTAPENETEQLLQEIWKKCLDQEHISTEDTFFMLGGDSLKAIRCINEIQKQFSITLSLKQIFQNQTIRALAAIIDKQRDDGNDEIGEI